MICPNCSTELKRTERTGQVCSHCHRRFALDPKVHGRGMHDLRIRRCAESLTDGGRLKVTVTQLWYRSRSYSIAWRAREARGIRPGIRWSVALTVCAGLLVYAVLGSGAPAVWARTAAVFVLVVPGLFRYERARPAGSSLSPTEEGFRQLMTGDWRRAYGGLPPGVVNDAARIPGYAASRPPRPRAVILCTDHAVAVFLEANDLPVRLRAVLVEADPGSAHEALVDLPGLLPVVVLHDASALGALLAPLLRMAHPDRAVVDAGLPVAAVRGRLGAIHRVSPVTAGSHVLAVDAGELRAVAGLSEQEATWLAEGFWSPIAAVPPPLLATVVEEAVERAVAMAAARPGSAPAYGFLTWPDTDGAADADTSGKKGTPSA
ncbi:MULTISPECIES: hypothetical protein [unclassified Streptomyces]|uniref:hypothetical protein n=1 Tax=unclassified Streptomyces TaxID=2593676 RepID=UPI00225A924E|nr:hypothetical protein [Streptomyces sp. NBC_00047]MCX5609998.1 hypothetical protein [Streptomyces sp. NBC_00047]